MKYNYKNADEVISFDELCARLLDGKDNDDLINDLMKDKSLVPYAIRRMFRHKDGSQIYELVMVEDPQIYNIERAAYNFILEDVRTALSDFPFIFQEDEPFTPPPLPLKQAWMDEDADEHLFEDAPPMMPLKKKTEISTRERNSLLLIAAAMAKMKPIDDLTARGMATKVAKQISLMGGDLSDDTVRNKLEEIQSIIEKNA